MLALGFSFLHSDAIFSLVCPGWVIGSLEALAGAKPGQIIAGTYATGIVQYFKFTLYISYYVRVLL